MIPRDYQRNCPSGRDTTRSGACAKRAYIRQGVTNVFSSLKPHRQGQTQAGLAMICEGVDIRPIQKDFSHLRDLTYTYGLNKEKKMLFL